MDGYRAEIDGLRAVAIIAILLFYVGVPSVGGGFTGLDILFVVSGFLIAWVVAGPLAGAFSFRGYLERCVRRFLPTLILVCAVTLGVFYFTFFVDDYIRLARSVIPTLFFVSDAHFLYAEKGALADFESFPLHHTWAVSLTLQYTILFPLLYVALKKYLKDKAKISFAGLCIASLALFWISSGSEPRDASYLLPFRFWEFGLGSLLVLYIPKPREDETLLDNVIAFAGFAVLVSGFFIFSSSADKVPVAASFASCAAAVFLLYAGNRSVWMQRVLGSAPAVIIGRMSYSLYMWCWPVLAYVHYRFEDELGATGLTLVLSATFILSYLSWRFVEAPFRNPAFLKRREVFLLGGVSVAALSLCSLIILHFDGFPSRFPDEAFAFHDAEKDTPVYKYETCLAGQPEGCLIGDRNSEVIRAVVWGDSHAAAMAPAIDALLSDRALKGVVHLKRSCPGLISDYAWNDPAYAECQEHNSKVFAWISATPTIRYVFLPARWQTVARKFDDGRKEAETKFFEAMRDTALALEKKGIKVFFFAPVPRPDFDVPHCLLRQALFGHDFFACEPPDVALYEERQAIALAAFERLKAQYPVFYPHMSLCSLGRCTVLRKQTVMYSDHEHLSTRGAALISPEIGLWFDEHRNKPRL